jgi:hypothetical protein
VTRLDPDDEDPEVVVCMGPPWCDLTGDAAIACARGGCPFCDHICIHPDGTETRYRLSGTA